MIKSELINKCKELHVRVPFRMIIDLYKDDDEIPDELIRILFEPTKPMQQILYTSAAFNEEFTKAISDYVNKKNYK